MMSLVERLWNEQDGQGLVEYALILALIAIIVIGAVKAVGTKADETFDKIERSL